ncbi:MAG: hypothetical protein K5829_13975 [Treponema sp.]|nr:hypothetical protein [Treponema sp.]
MTRTKARKYIITLFISFFSFYLAAQSLPENEKILLPDLTTVISSEEEEESSLYLPPFEDLVVLPEKTADIIIELEAEEPLEEEVPPEPVQVTIENESFQVQGLIGGGFPSLFVGDFSLTQPESKSPFDIQFYHRSQNGFAFQSLSEGFYKKNTLIKMGKTLSYKNIESSFGASYDEVQNGFQNQTEYETSLIQDTIALFGNFKWQPGYGITVSSSLDSDYYFRFEDLLSASSAPDWIKAGSEFNLEPQASFKWDYSTKNNNQIALAFKTLYNLEVLTSKSVTDSRSLNRVDLGLSFEWKNDIISAKTTFDTIFGNKLNGHPIILPFSAGLDFNIPVYFSDRRLFIQLQGGLKSSQTNNSELEKLYAFSALSGLTSETSDWFSHFIMTVPLKSAFSASAQVDYSITALGNGVWQPLYSDENYNSGLYTYVQNSQEILSTLFSLDFKYKIFTISAGLKSNWNDIPVLESKHFINLKSGLVSPGEKIGFTIEGGWHIDADDSTPFLNSDFYVKINPAVTMLLTVSDLLKLTGNTKRLYAGKYISESGSLCFSVKFVL